MPKFSQGCLFPAISFHDGANVPLKFRECDSMAGWRAALSSKRDLSASFPEIVPAKPVRPAAASAGRAGRPGATPAAALAAVRGGRDRRRRPPPAPTRWGAGEACGEGAALQIVMDGGEGGGQVVRESQGLDGDDAVGGREGKTGDGRAMTVQRRAGSSQTRVPVSMRASWRASRTRTAAQGARCGSG